MGSLDSARILCADLSLSILDWSCVCERASRRRRFDEGRSRSSW